MKKRRKSKGNLLDFVPIKKVDYFIDGEGKAVLLRPKFRSSIFRFWLRLVAQSLYFKVHLDEVGTFVWKLIDGERTVKQIAELTRERFGDRVEPCEERVGIFIRELKQGDFIDYK